ncbi:MAG: hypothetical protein ACK4NS_05095 [Saprospiraceae bacterium]
MHHLSPQIDPLMPALALNPDFPDESRVWIYVCNRELDPTERAEADQEISRFVQKWTAHNQALHAQHEFVTNRILILMADETQAGASGCAIDKSVHFLESLGGRLGLDFFDRLTWIWIGETGAYEFGSKEAFKAELKRQKLASDPLVVNTLALTKGQLAETWLTPLSKSWHKKLL